MGNNWFNNGWAAITPFIMIVILNLLYASFSIAFVYCQWGNAGCKSIDVKNVLPRNEQNQVHISHVDFNNSSEPNRNIIAKRYSGRISWSFLMGIYMLFSAVSFALSIILTHKSFLDWGKPPVIGIAALVLLSALLGITLHSLRDSYMPVMATLLENTIKVEVENIVQVANRINSIGFAASFSLVLASCAVLLPPIKQGLDGLRHLSARMSNLRAILYAGTLMLVSGVVLMRSLFNWSKAFIPQTKESIEITEIFTSEVLSADAGFYTLILAAVYLPAAFILQARARSLTIGTIEEAEREKILKESNLTFSFTESLPRIAAILAPLLAGPVGELLSKLPK
jgi:hypothetical protein